MESLALDVRNAVKALLHAGRTFLIATTLAIALAIGVNTASLSVVRGVLLRPLPYRDPAALVMIWNQTRTVIEPERILATPNDLTIWRSRAWAFEDVAALEMWDGNPSAQMDFSGPNGTERLRGAYVTPNFFDLLGVSALIGRTFQAAADEDGQSVVLSHSAWKAYFAADPEIAGREIQLVTGRDRDRRTLRVIGVLPSGMQFTYPLETQLWVLRSWRRAESAPAGALLYWVIARLRSTVSLGQAQRNMATLSDELAREFPNQAFRRRVTFRLEPVHEHLIGRARSLVLLLAAVAVMILTIAAVNVSGVLLARTASRARDLAIRGALGATPRRLFRQLLIEGMLLSFVGGGVGLLLAAMFERSIRAWIPSTIPRVDEIGVDWWVGFVALAVLALTSVITSVVPSWHGTRLSLRHHLHEGTIHATDAPGTKKWTFGVVMTQVLVLAVLLLIGALLLRSWSNLRGVDLGFDGRGVLTMEMRLLGSKYRSDAALIGFQERLLTGLRAIPQIDEVGLTSAVPMRGVDWRIAVSRKDGKVLPSDPVPVVNLRQVDRQYFSVIGIPLKRGRFFTDADNQAAPPVAILSESAATRFFPGEDPIGKEIAGELPRLIVGIVGDVRYARVSEPPTPALYVPRSQEPSELMCLVIRPRSAADNVVSAILNAIRTIDPDQPVERVSSLDRIVDESLEATRLYTSATLLLAGLALLLTVIGLYAIMSHAVTDRKRELSVRVALGATRRQLLLQLLFQGLMPVVVGLAAGLVAAYWIARSLKAFLFGVGFSAPFEYACVAGLIIGVSTLACYLPARSAVSGLATLCLRQE